MEHRPFYGWTVLAAAAIIICLGFGMMLSLGVFLKPVQESTGWSRTGISTISLVAWIALGLGSVTWGALSDRFGTRRVVIAGGLLQGAGLVLASRATELWHLYLTFGILVGFGVGAYLAPLTATATRWFTARRGLAVSIVSGGIGLGILVVSPLARSLVSLLGWRGAFLVLGNLAWLVVLPTSMLIRNAPEDGGGVAMGGRVEGERDWQSGEAMRSPQFWVIALTHFACCAAHSGPIFHMVAHASDQGIARMTAAAILGFSGFASIAGRVGAGLLADRFGAKPTLVAGLAIQAMVIVLYLFARDAAAFWMLAVVFGVAYGGVMPLYALVTRSYFGDRIMGTAYGMVFFISTIGMGIGSLAGGWFHDALGSYAGLYIASAAIGGAGVALALTFRPPRLPVRAAAARAVQLSTPTGG